MVRRRLLVGSSEEPFANDPSVFVEEGALGMGMGKLISRKSQVAKVTKRQ